MNEEQARAEYRDLLPRLGELRASLEATLRRFESSGTEVRSRIKTWESVREKMSRASVGQLEDIQDLVGIRLVVPDLQAFLDLSELIRGEFRISSYDSQHLRIGESSAHFVVRGSEPSLARVSAEIQVLTSAEDARRALEHELNYRVAIEESQAGEPAEAAMRSLGDIVVEFEALIERPGVHEKRDVHGFVEAHNFLLFPNPDAVTSEVPIGLGTEFRIDFLVQKPDGSYLLVEIENPQADLFTKAGEFSAAVNHALRQVEDWQEWIEANLPTVERYYPGIRSPEALVIIGRDVGLANSERRRFARRNVNMRGRVALKTYDDLLRDAQAYVRGLGRALGGA